jgi:hypothetical protein
MSTAPTASQARQADEHFREVSFEIQALAQAYINSGVDNDEVRSAMRGIMALTAGLSAVLQHALMPRQ